MKTTLLAVTLTALSFTLGLAVAGRPEDRVAEGTVAGNRRLLRSRSRSETRR